MALQICCHVWNRGLPRINDVGLLLILAEVLITSIVCAVLPGKSGGEYATKAAVWSKWQNGTGYTSNGFVFCMGMLNGAFAVGTPGKKIRKVCLRRYYANCEERLCHSPC